MIFESREAMFFIPQCYHHFSHFACAGEALFFSKDYFLSWFSKLALSLQAETVMGRALSSHSRW